jgi:hypothetical protein
MAWAKEGFAAFEQTASAARPGVFPAGGQADLLGSRLGKKLKEAHGRYELPSGPASEGSDVPLRDVFA